MASVKKKPIKLDGTGRPAHALNEPKIDIGCGRNKKEGFFGIDVINFEGKVDLVYDVRQTPWPFQSNSVQEVHSSHFVEHLTGVERIAFFNELYRVMKIGGVACIITPDWSHSCAYGDPTHQWPPMSSWYPLYLNKQWRDGNAPHVAYTCDFDWSQGGGWDEWLSVRNQEFRGFAMQRYVNSMRDLIVNISKVKREPPKDEKKK